MRTSSRPNSVNCCRNQCPRAVSPKGGAAIRATSSCQWANCGSCERSQAKAERISGSADSRVTSCCGEGNDSDTSALELSAMGLIPSYYNALRKLGVSFGGTADYGRVVTLPEGLLTSARPFAARTVTDQWGDGVAPLSRRRAEQCTTLNPPSSLPTSARTPESPPRSG